LKPGLKKRELKEKQKKAANWNEELEAGGMAALLSIQPECKICWRMFKVG